MSGEAARLARTVARRFPIKRLYLYGSVANARPLSVWSDIDLAVEGLPPDLFLELAGALAAGTDYPVDLKPIEELAEDQRRSIALRGVLLYERD
jgi:predicted nucleotidyltransferase